MKRVKNRPANQPRMTFVRLTAAKGAKSHHICHHVHFNSSCTHGFVAYFSQLLPLFVGSKSLMRRVRILMGLPLTLEVEPGPVTGEDLTRLTAHKDESHFCDRFKSRDHLREGA